MNRILIMLCGISGMGKSYLAKKKIIPQLAARKPVIIFDRLGEYGKEGQDISIQRYTYSGIRDFFVKIQENECIIEKQVHVIKCEKDEDYIMGIGFFRKLERPVSLILDEAHDIFKASEFREAREKVVQIARYGRHAGIDLMLISQRTYDIPPDVRSQFLGAISFKQNHRDDIKALDEKGWQGAEKILDLEPKEFKIFGEIPSHLKLS